ncbi:MAG TPA: alpha/beta fold hydrolase [Bacteriovoracaceae bacterium]|nr:alpha/beta fold hydrolase [Bacteriovoracaceae bacterium]
MIHVFHGFLGSPNDFDFLPHRKDIKCHDLSSDLNINLQPDDTLIGYSMGGRLALDLAAKAEFKIKRLVLINAHPGFSTEDEKVTRRQWEGLIEQKLLDENFMSYWNSLPIFKGDSPLSEMSPEKLLNSRKIFQKLRLSAQKDYLPEIEKQLDKVFWIIGLQDEKYCGLAERDLLPRGIRCRFIDGGHRLFQHPTSLLRVLNEEGVL